MKAVSILAAVAIAVSLCGCGGKSDPYAQTSAEIDNLCAACDVFVSDVGKAKTGKEAAAAFDKFGKTSTAVAERMKKIAEENPNMDQGKLKPQQEKAAEAMKKMMQTMMSLMMKFPGDPDVQKAVMNMQKNAPGAMGMGK